MTKENQMKLTCRGCYALGTACGKCDKCKDERQRLKQAQFIDKYASGHQKVADVLKPTCPIEEIKTVLHKAWVTSAPKTFGEAMEIAAKQMYEYLQEKDQWQPIETAPKDDSTTISKVLSELNCVGVALLPKKAIYQRLMGDDAALIEFFGDPEQQAKKPCTSFCKTEGMSNAYCRACTEN